MSVEEFPDPSPRGVEAVEEPRVLLMTKCVSASALLRDLSRLEDFYRSAAVMPVGFGNGDTQIGQKKRRIKRENRRDRKARKAREIQRARETVSQLVSVEGPSLDADLAREFLLSLYDAVTRLSCIRSLLSYEEPMLDQTAFMPELYKSGVSATELKVAVDRLHSCSREDVSDTELQNAVPAARLLLQVALLMNVPFKDLTEASDRLRSTGTQVNVDSLLGSFSAELIAAVQVELEGAILEGVGDEMIHGGGIDEEDSDGEGNAGSRHVPPAERAELNTAIVKYNRGMTSSADVVQPDSHEGDTVIEWNGPSVDLSDCPTILDETNDPSEVDDLDEERGSFPTAVPTDSDSLSDEPVALVAPVSYEQARPFWRSTASLAFGVAAIIAAASLPGYLDDEGAKASVASSSSAPATPTTPAAPVELAPVVEAKPPVASVPAEWVYCGQVARHAQSFECGDLRVSPDCPGFRVARVTPSGSLIERDINTCVPSTLSLPPLPENPQAGTYAIPLGPS